MRAYLAGNLCLTEPGRRYIRGRLQPEFRKAGIKLRHVWGEAAIAVASTIGIEHPIMRSQYWWSLQKRERLMGEAMMRRSDLVIAALDGTCDDDRVVLEIEYALSLDRRLVGLSTDLRPARLGLPSSSNEEAERLILGGGGRLATSLQDLLSMVSDLKAVTGAGKELGGASV